MLYNRQEIILKNKIDALHHQWITRIIENDDSCREEELRELYIPDGFFPNYTNQRIKILFIGREGLELSGQNYISCLYDAYHNKVVGGKSLNRYQFHSTMLYISYALEHKIYDWSKLPYAVDFIDEFGKPNGCSFAFMNLSKFSNESGNWWADEELIDSFIRLSHNEQLNLFQEEIDILNPDLIIGMNLEARMDVLGRFSDFAYYGNKDLCAQTLLTTKGKYPYIDAWHFSAPGKSPEKEIFNPIINYLKDSGII